MKKLLFFLFAITIFIPVLASAKLKAPDVLDEEDIKTDHSLSEYKTVGIRPFKYDNIEYDNVDDDERGKMKHFMRECQEDLTKSLRRNLEDENVRVVILDEDGNGKADMIVEGEFTGLNLGSAAARIFGGFGSGQAGITVKGKLVDAETGDTLATFKHENSSGISDGEKWSLIERECTDLGEKISEFIVKLRR